MTMPFAEINDELVYISRRSLCDECLDKPVCVNIAPRIIVCQRFHPEQLNFMLCKVCHNRYEIHTAMRNDFADNCPDCDQIEHIKRLARLGVGEDDCHE